jgi:hypothetical protein
MSDDRFRTRTGIHPTYTSLAHSHSHSVSGRFSTKYGKRGPAAERHRRSANERRQLHCADTSLVPGASRVGSPESRLRRPWSAPVHLGRYLPTMSPDGLSSLPPVNRTGLYGTDILILFSFSILRISLCVLFVCTYLLFGTTSGNDTTHQPSALDSELGIPLCNFLLHLRIVEG